MRTLLGVMAAFMTHPALAAPKAGAAASACARHAANEPSAWPSLKLQALNATTWWVPALAADSDAYNRGHTSHVLLVAHGRRLWLLGAGPSPAFAQALACLVQRELGRSITDVITPWAHAELALGASGLPKARHWAHADVVRAMRERCARCEARMRQRLHAHSADLGPKPVRIPDHSFHGAQGQLGPLRWWRLWRDPTTAVTVFEVPDSQRPLLTAHGLMWVGAAPDLRDSNIASMQLALQALANVTTSPNAATTLTLLGEQGPLDASPTRIVAQHQHYLQALQDAVTQAQARGDDGLTPPASLPGVADSMTQSKQHALNWQRAWRQADDASLAPTKPRQR